MTREARIRSRSQHSRLNSIREVHFRSQALFTAKHHRVRTKIWYCSDSAHEVHLRTQLSSLDSVPFCGWKVATSSPTKGIINTNEMTQTMLGIGLGMLSRVPSALKVACVAVSSVCGEQETSAIWLLLNLHQSRWRGMVYATRSPFSPSPAFFGIRADLWMEGGDIIVYERNHKHEWNDKQCLTPDFAVACVVVSSICRDAETWRRCCVGHRARRVEGSEIVCC